MSLAKSILNDYLEEQKVESEVLTETAIPKDSREQLKSKMDSLIDSIQNLSRKKLRIEFELKRQKKALARKREELKRTSHSSKAKATLSLEGSNLNPQLEEKRVEDIKRVQNLLQESARILEE